RRVRARRIRVADEARPHEAGVLDDQRLQVPPRRRLRQDGCAGGGEHQLPGRGGDRCLEGGGEDAEHPGRAVQGDMHGQHPRHCRDDQGEEGAVELRQRLGRVGRRHRGAMRAAAGQPRRRLPVSHRHARRPGSSA
uniref:Uncharacterized protein n=1 Tax=Triticum urartu TaxID=4572 RepID=A0A8R7VAE1_TRIUA